jgi:hypothetical protein
VNELKAPDFRREQPPEFDLQKRKRQGERYKGDFGERGQSHEGKRIV